MIGLAREWEIKLSLLESIARSQEALARMLETAAAVTAEAGLQPAVLREHVRALDGMQASLLRLAVVGSGWRRPKRGRPVRPWFHQSIYAGRRLRRPAGGVRD